MKKKRVLIVDDELSVADAMAGILSDGGYDAVKSLTGLAAVSEAERSKFDLAIVDLRLPDIDGLEVLNRILQHNRNIIAILTSAYEIAPAAASQPAVRGVLAKPFSPTDLLEATGAALALRDRPPA